MFKKKNKDPPKFKRMIGEHRSGEQQSTHTLIISQMPSTLTLQAEQKELVVAVLYAQEALQEATKELVVMVSYTQVAVVLYA